MRLVEVPSSWAVIVRVVARYEDAELAALLTAGEVADLGVLRAEAARRERAASRVAAKSIALARGIVDDATRIRFTKSESRPIVVIDDAPTPLHVSFSHTAGIGAAALDEAPVGLDLERERVIDPRATKFFLRDDERENASSSRLANPLLHWWCAKEAAFKLTADHATLLRVPLELECETDAGLVLRGPRGSRVETVRLGDSLVAALAVGSWNRPPAVSRRRGDEKAAVTKPLRDDSPNC